MNSSHRPDRLAQARWEADRHAAVLADALESWAALAAASGLLAAYRHWVAALRAD